MNHAELEAIADGISTKAWNELNREDPETAKEAIAFCKTALSLISKAESKLQTAAAHAENTTIEPKILSVIDGLEALETDVRKYIREMGERV